jgi:hypothetical protein
MFILLNHLLNMPEIIINNFSDGITGDSRDTTTATFALSQNFDIYSKSSLVPYKGVTAQTINVASAPTMPLANLTMAVNLTDSGGDNDTYSLGKTLDGGVYKPSIYKESSVTSGQWGHIAESVVASGTPLYNSFTPYNQKLYYLIKSGSNTILQEYDPSDSSTAAIGTISDNYATYCKPFVHPLDNILYVGIGNTIASYDGTTFTASAKSIPDTSSFVSSLTDYGVYLAIAMCPKYISEKSKVLLWGRDTSLETFQESIDFGDGKLKVLENLGGILTGVSIIGGSTFILKPKLILRGYAGGAAEVIKTIQLTDSAIPSISTYKARISNKLYFIATASVNEGSVKQIWVTGKNRNGNWFITPDRLIQNNDEFVSPIGFSFIGDTLYTGTDEGFYVTDENVSATSTYYSMTNPNMPISDRSKKKQLKGVSITVDGATYASSSEEVTVSYRVNNGTWYEIIDSTIDSYSTVDAGKQKDAKAFLDGTEYQFKIESLLGVEIRELKYKYDLI